MVFAIIGWMAAIQIFGYLGLVLILRSDHAPWEQYTGYALYLVLVTWLISLILMRFLQ